METQISRDPSEKKIEIQHICTGLTVPKNQRRQLWNSFFDEKNTLSIHALGYVMNGFNNPKRNDELKEYIDLWVNNLIKAYQRSTEFGNAFFMNLFPKTDDLDSLIEKLQSVVKVVPKSQSTLTLKINEAIDDLKRRSKSF